MYTHKHASFWHPILAPLPSMGRGVHTFTCLLEPASHRYTPPTSTRGKWGSDAPRYSRLYSRWRWRADGACRQSGGHGDNHGGCSINTNYHLRHLRSRALALADACAYRTKEKCTSETALYRHTSTCYRKNLRTLPWTCVRGRRDSHD